MDFALAPEIADALSRAVAEGDVGYAAAGQSRLAEAFAGFPDVWVATREQIARHWAETHPPAPVRTAAAPPSG